VILAIASGSYQASDAVHLLPMLETIHPNTGQHPVMLTALAAGCEAVAGSFSTANLVACLGKTLIATISTSRQQPVQTP
jgi:p-aminobenzoyl-glutamate transporter AbgT